MTHKQARALAAIRKAHEADLLKWSKECWDRAFKTAVLKELENMTEDLRREAVSK